MFRLVARGAVTAEYVLKVIRRGTRSGPDALSNAVVRKLGEDSVYLYDMLNVEENGRTKPFSVWDLYITYLSNPRTLYDDAGRIDYVNQLYWLGQGDIPTSEKRMDWMRQVVWPHLENDERLQLQAAADFIRGKFYGFEWEPRRKGEYRYNLEAMNTLQALVWPLVEREKKWQRKYRVTDEHVTESAPVQPVLLLESGEKPRSADEPDSNEVDPIAGRRQHVSASWKKKQERLSQERE